MHAWICWGEARRPQKLPLRQFAYYCHLCVQLKATALGGGCAPLLHAIARKHAQSAMVSPSFSHISLTSTLPNLASVALTEPGWSVKGALLNQTIPGAIQGAYV